MIGDEHRLTKGYVARHIPPKSRLGVDVAILDIAQDFLLAHLAERGVFDLVIFKGGTALRKLFAGAQGRFSTDIDLAAVDVEGDRNALAEMVAAECSVTLGPFAFNAAHSRGRWQIAVTSEFGNPSLKMKLDVGPPCWLRSESRAFVQTSTQQRYGFVPPALNCMRLEEMLAEKIARLARKATARDASDLVWVAQTSPYSQFDRARTRRLAMLKVWVDNNGMNPGWRPALACAPFSVESWLARRDRWDDEQIGMLASPPPSLAELEADLWALYGWLTALSADEARWARADSRDRGEVLAAVRALDSTALSDVHLY
ncbi:nucleotidyl transferase AbiEii/AbiGii toxin family protein [soil metagenome]